MFKKTTIAKKLFTIALFSLLLTLFNACKKTADMSVNTALQNAIATTTAPLSITSNQDLINYKNSPHQIYAAYYRAWYDRATTGSMNNPVMSELPDSLDMVLVFPGGSPSEASFFNQLKLNYIPALHAKGTKVIITTSFNDFDWWKNNIAPAGTADNVAGYNAWASYRKNVNDSMGYDGIDIDMEANPSGATLTKYVALVNALSQYFGPSSGSSRLFIYDTNQEGTISFFTQTYSKFSYVFLQAYGRSASSLTTTFNGYATYISPSKFLPGFSFYEENGAAAGNSWGDVAYPDNDNARCYEYARWQPNQGQKAGVFSYGIDRDVPTFTNNVVHPDYHVSRKIMSTILNPAGTTNPPVNPDGIVSGATYKITTAMNGTSALDVNGAGATDGTKTIIWNYGDGNNQKWKVTKLANGNYKLNPLHAPAKALNVNGSSSTNGATVNIWTDNGSTAQQWVLTNAGTNQYTMSPVCAPGKMMDVSGANTANGTNVIIWQAHNGANQKWIFTKL